MKPRRVVMTLETETDVGTGALRMAEWWQEILEAAGVEPGTMTVVQASPLVIKERKTPDGKRAT